MPDDCTIQLSDTGAVLGGDCACNYDGTEYSSTIVSGFSSTYSLGNCQSNVGYMTFPVVSEPFCGETDWVAFDFAVVNGGSELIGVCNGAEDTIYGEPNAGASWPCVFEAYLQ